MKNLIRVLVLPILVLAAVACNGSKSFQLTGKIDGTTATEAYLAYNDVVDTVAMEDGEFVFKGKLETPMMGALMIEGRQLSLMLENTEMSVEGAIDLMGSQNQYEEMLISGSESQLEFEAFLTEVKKHSTTKEDYIGFCKSYIEEHTSSFFTPYVLASVVPLFQPEEVMTMLESLSDNVAGTETVLELKKQIKNVMNMAQGGQVPDFTMDNVDGEPVTLSEVYAKHKYLLIDFWASWCSPCRAENPNVVAAYKAYSAKGLGILGVSLDKDKDAWLKAIEDDKLTWEHVSDLKGWENAAAKEYAVRGIPANFLVDSKGTIVAKDLRGPALEAKLKELLD